MGARALRLFAVRRAITDYSVDLQARTGREAPQVRLECNAVSIGSLQALIVGRERHSPRDVDDGRVIWQGALDPVDPTVACDILCEPKTWMYYKLFVLLDGQWVEPDNNEASAFTGATPKLEATGLQTTLNNAYAYGAPYLASNARFASVTSVDGWEAGDWLKVGNIVRHVTRVETFSRLYNDDIHEPYLDDEIPPAGAQVETTTVYRLHFAPLGVVPDSDEVTPVENEQITFVSAAGAFAGLGTITRSEGTWAENGFVYGADNRLCVRVQGTGLFDGLYAVHLIVGKTMVVKGTRETSPASPDVSTGLSFPFSLGDLVTTAARVLGPPGISGSEPVYQLRQVNSDVGAFLYDEAVADAVPIGDAEEDQGFVLSQTTDAEGEQVNLGSPGRQLSAHRFIRTLAAPLANAKAAVESLEGISDVWTAPVPFLRQLIENYNTGVADHDSDVEVRNLTALQPDLISMRGRLDILKIWLENLTGEACAFVYGRDLLARFALTDGVTPSEGFGWDGGLTCPSSLVVGDTTEVTVDQEGYDVPEWLVGMTFRSVDTGDHEILSVSVPDLLVVSGTADIGFPGEFTIVETRGQRYAIHPSFCSPDPDSVFNDKGLLIHLKSGINLAQKAKIEAICRDWKPISESWLVYSGETLLIDLSE